VVSGLREVSSDDLLTPHVAADAYAFVNMVLSPASASKLGIRASGSPKAAPRGRKSSITNISTLSAPAGAGDGGGVGASGLGGGTGEGGDIVPLVVLHLLVTLLFFVGGPGFRKQVPLLL
jgi:hypothetical protein